MINFDDGPYYEFICQDFSIEQLSTDPERWKSAIAKHVIAPSGCKGSVMLAFDSSELPANDSKSLPKPIGIALLVLRSQVQTTLQILHARRSLHLELSDNVSTWGELFGPLDSTHPNYPQN